MKQIRLLLVDNHPTFLRLAAAFLHEHYSGEVAVVGTLPTVRKNLTPVEALHPDVVVFDPYSPARSAKGILPVLRAALPGVGLVVLSARSEGAYRRAALAAGADEFVDKADIVAELMPAIRRAHLLSPPPPREGIESSRNPQRIHLTQLSGRPQITRRMVAVDRLGIATGEEHKDDASQV